MRARRASAALVAGALCGALPAFAQDAGKPQGSDSGFTLRTSIKSSLLLSRAPDDPVLFPERTSAVSFWRLRVEPQGRISERVTVGGAYEERLRVFSQSPGFGGGGVLPPETRSPFRITQLDWSLSETSASSWRHEIDRGWAAFHFPRAEVTVGRQAIGWGRGVLFGAVDLFSPFSPLEADREWRRGVDALRADVKLADRVSLDGVGAFGETLDASAFAARLRGYAGEVDVEIVGGRRARDLFGGATSSAAVGDAEVHGEVAVFRTPGPAGPDRDSGRTVAKAVAGASYRFPVGTGVLVYAEYHYSGFGAARPEGILPLLATPTFQERYLRGDTQILQRHALGALASSELSPELSLGGLWLHSLVDGSGLLSPSATMSFGDKVSVLASLYVPYGRPPQGLVLRSEYGASSLSGFLQVRIYN